MKRMAIAAVLLGFVPAVHADVYAYVNEHGDYVVTRSKPDRTVSEYAILTDDGEFVRLVRAREPNVPITHWRPWFIPRDPDAIELPDVRERTGTVEIDEVER